MLAASRSKSLFQYADLTLWCQKIGLISQVETQELLRRAGELPDEAELTLAMIVLRGAIYRIITVHVNGQSHEKTDLDLVNAELANAAKSWKLKSTLTGFAWEWDTSPDDLARMLGPIARSVADLLTSAELYRVGICADEDGCGFAFFDTSRNRSRRWCSMEDCGNRAKAQRHYKRQKVDGT